MRYNEEIIQNVIEANDIVDIISQYVTLKRSGRSHMGCCPFHNEKTPSFSVSQEKQLYHCFGCGVGGNVIGFVMAIENMGFPEALEYLADRAGITLPRIENPEKDREYEKKERLYELHRQLANHYYRVLKKNGEAQRYLAGRGMSAATIKGFGIGLSLNEWQDACQYLQGQGFTEDELLESGLVLRGKNGRLYDRFRNRIMIPILNIRGKIIGFGGRQFGQSTDGPKYLNSPETLVFSKGYELYNLNQAKKKIVNEQMIIVEGYMDVIALCQYGIENAVAALGTAFTPYHAKTLSRYVKEVVLCFDGDRAGEGATEKAIAILKKSTLNIRVLRLGAEEDPDSFIREKGVEAFRGRIREADTVLDFELRQCARNHDTTNSDGKVKYLNEAITLLRTLSNSVEIELYAKKVARTAGVSAGLVMREATRVQKNGQAPAIRLPSQEAASRIPKAYGDAQVYILKYLFQHQDGSVYSRLAPEDFTPGFYQKLYSILKELAEGGGGHLSLPVVLERFETEEERRAFSELSFENGTDDGELLMESMNTIHYYHCRLDIQRLKDEIAMLDERSPEGIQLVTQLMALKKELSKIQEVRNGG